MTYLPLPIVGVPVRRFLDTVGDGSGTTDAIGNYSVTPQTFRCNVPAGEHWYFTGIDVQLSDGGALSQSNYGATGAPLTNGFDLYYVQNSVTYKLTSQTIKSNDHFVHNGFEYQIINFSGGVDSSDADLDFTAFVNLSGDLGDYVYTTLNDDFSALVDQTFLVKAYHY